MIQDLILDYINKNTNPVNMDCFSTRTIGRKFGLNTVEAYIILSRLANDRKIIKLDPVNGDNFQCCDWMRYPTKEEAYDMGWDNRYKEEDYYKPNEN